MSLEAWIYVKPAAWAAIAPPLEGMSKEIWHYSHRNGITGFWKTWNTDYEVYNVIGSQAALDALITELGAMNVDRVFAWEQGPGFDSLDEWPTVPDDVLAVMMDHVTYDVDGNPTGATPATMEAPNWGHVFLGQGERIFAGDFNNDFSGDFL